MMVMIMLEDLFICRLGRIHSSHIMPLRLRMYVCMYLSLSLSLSLSHFSIFLRVDDELMRELEDDVDLKPSWLEGIVVKPDNVWRNRQLKIWGILTALGVCFPPAIETFVILQYFVLTAQLLYRGQIMDPGNMWMMSSGEKAKGSHRKYTPFLAAGIMLAAKVAVFALMPPFARSRRWTGTVGWVGENALYMTSNLFLQPYRGD